jgi:hypothetical protein
VSGHSLTNSDFTVTAKHSSTKPITVHTVFVWGLFNEAVSISGYSTKWKDQ